MLKFEGARSEKNCITISSLVGTKKSHSELKVGNGVKILRKDPVLRVQGLTKQIGAKKIVDKVSFEVYPGEIFGFLGPNGAGKTTTIRMIVGLSAISEGDVWIKGVSLKKNFEQAIAHVGGIVENPELYKFLTGYQNLLHFWRMCKGVSKERIDEVVRIVGLEKRIHEKVKTYSLGMRQRLGLAQALLHSPSILILDEPTNGLDPAGIREFRDLLKKLAAETGLAVFVSSHILSEMELMCDRIGIIQQGKLIEVKEVRDFVDAEEEHAVLFLIDPLPEADSYLKKMFPDYQLTVTEDGILAKIKREQIPDLNAMLVTHGIRVYGIQKATKTLEDRFLEITGGGQIA